MLLFAVGSVSLVAISQLDKRFHFNLYVLRAAYATTLVGLGAWGLWFVAAIIVSTLRILKAASVIQ